MLQVQYFQPKGYQFYEAEPHQHQSQTKDPEENIYKTILLKKKMNQLSYHHEWMKHTCELEKVKFPPDANWVVNHSLTDMVSLWFTRPTCDSDIPTYNAAEGCVLILETIEDKVMEEEENRRGWAIGIGGPRQGCFFRKIWIGVWPKLAIWSSMAALCNLSSIVSKSAAPSYVK